MPTITFPNSFAAGDTTSAPDVMDNIFDPDATPKSLDVINGYMDRDNMENPLFNPIDRRAVRSGSLSVSGMVGATANLDYFRDIFQDLFRAQSVYPGDPTRLQASTAGNDPLDRFVPIPSLCITLDVPYAARAVFLKWGLHTSIDGEMETPGAGQGGGVGGSTLLNTGVFRLKINDTWIDSQRRCISRGDIIDNVSYQRSASRLWQGNYVWENVAAGRHNVGIYLCHDALQCRVRTRRMQYAIKR